MIKRFVLRPLNFFRIIQVICDQTPFDDCESRDGLKKSEKTHTHTRRERE